MTLSPARRLLLLVAGCLLAAGAQPPEEEEEKKPAAPTPAMPADPPPPEKKAESEDKKPDPPSDDNPVENDGAYIAKLPDLARAADTTPHEPLKPIFKRFGLAFDQLDEAGGKSGPITPLGYLWGVDVFPASFGVADIAPDGTVGDGREVARNRVLGVLPFERLALEAAAVLLGESRNSPAPALPPAVRQEAAERLLREVLFFHDTARTGNRRIGKSWDRLKADLGAKLADVRVRLVRQAGADRDWPRLRTLFTLYADRYRGPADRPVLEALADARLAEAVELSKSDRLGDLEQARELLAQYDERFRNGPSEAAKLVRQALGRKAKEFLNRLDQAQGNPADTRRLLDAVQALDPDNPVVRDRRRELKFAYPTLVVGTRRLPERMSPALARFDSEAQAVELLFEGLLERYPDPQAGVAFRPALASDRPAVAGGVREVELVRNAGWGTGGDPLDAADVNGTWNLYRFAPGSWAAAPSAWLDEPAFEPGEPGRVRLRFASGFPDPRLILTQKILPATTLRQTNTRADALSFAKNPVGTGPYRLQPGGDGDVVFVANPGYSRRPGRAAQPAIQEIRFTKVGGEAGSEADALKLANDFRTGKVHLVTDVPTSYLPTLKADNNQGNTLRIAEKTADRRVWGLAVNHRRPHLHGSELRRGLSRAINRELILDEVFRAGRADLHAAQSGPYPAGAWTAPLSSPPLFEENVAEKLLAAGLSAPGAPSTLTLGFPDDDPQAKAACDRIKAMLEKAAAGKLTVSPEPLPPRTLLDRVEADHRFDLAYVPFDYPDIYDPVGLGTLLDPAAAGPGGRNVTGWRSTGAGTSPADQRLAGLLDEARKHQDPARLRRIGQDIHAAFNEVVPFVPLWRLDRHVVLATAVTVLLPGQTEPAPPAMLEPRTLFSGVGRWRVE